MGVLPSRILVRSCSRRASLRGALKASLRPLVGFALGAALRLRLAAGLVRPHARRQIQSVASPMRKCFAICATGVLATIAALT